MTIPLALAPLAAYRRFVNYSLDADPDRPGKTIKRPVDVVTGLWCRVNAPEHQYTYAEAAATGRHVGFVFHCDDGFWFLDIDGALEDVPGGLRWSGLATTLCQRLAGAFVEVSQSGKGLHIIGRGVVPEHSCKNIPLGLELYTHDRFVALTGLQAQGDAGADLTGAINAVAAEFFPPNPRGEIAGWTAEPVEGWAGPADDAELLKIALGSGKRSAGAAFGNGHVTFEDLWTANEDALARKWPSDKGGYDASQADAALASHLAFWTGKDCERIRGLMGQSALARAKWEDRPDWLETTIMKASSVVTNVAKGKPKPESGDTPVLSRVGLVTNADTASVQLAGITFDGEHTAAPPRELVKGMLPTEGIAFVGGQSGAGKTFVVVDLAVALAAEGLQEFFGRRVRERVGVVIVAAEGYGTLADRLHVAKEHRGIIGTLPIAFIQSDLNLSSEHDAATLVAILSEASGRFSVGFGVRLGAVIIDTVAAAFAMENENDNAEAAAIIRRLNDIRAATGALILPVHHYGKTEDTGLRGASAFRAGADVVVSVLGDRNKATGAVSNRRLSLAKSRTREEGPISRFDLCPVTIGLDEDGDAYDSCVVVATDLTGAIGRRHSCPKSHHDLRAAFSAALDAHGEWRPSTDDQSQFRAARLEDVRKEFCRRRHKLGGDDRKQAEAARKAFSNALTTLVGEFRSMTDDRGVKWLSPAG